MSVSVWRDGFKKKIFAPLDQQEILPTKGDFFGIPRLKNDQNNKNFFREFNKRPPFHLIHVPYIFQKRNRELLLPPLPLIGTFSLFPYLFFLDCVPKLRTGSRPTQDSSQWTQRPWREGRGAPLHLPLHCRGVEVVDDPAAGVKRMCWNGVCRQEDVTLIHKHGGESRVLPGCLHKHVVQ